MTALQAALHVELRKARASRVMHTVTVLGVAGIAVLAGALVAAAQAGNPQILTQLGPLADETGWALLTGVTAQITAVGALLAFGVALSWIVGREFTDGTIAGLFALPVSRPAIALAKLCVYLLWVVAIALGLTALVLLAGLALGAGDLDSGVLAQLARQAGLIALTGLLATPAALAATWGRGPLPGIAVTVMIVVAAQVTAIASPAVAAWVPLSAPALWAMEPGAVHAGQLATVATVPIVFGAGACVTWGRLRLD